MYKLFKDSVPWSFLIQSFRSLIHITATARNINACWLFIMYQTHHQDKVRVAAFGFLACQGGDITRKCWLLVFVPTTEQSEMLFTFSNGVMKEVVKMGSNNSKRLLFFISIYAILHKHIVIILIYRLSVTTQTWGPLRYNIILR